MQSVSNFSTLCSIDEQLETICQSRFTGQLEVRSHSERWTLYFCLSRLIWAEGGIHPRRRWKRLLARSYPDLDLAQINICDSDAFECQNYHVLNVLLKRRLVTKEQLHTLIQNMLAEVLFDILQQETLAPCEYIQRAASANFLWESGIKLPITRVSVEIALRDARMAWKGWCDRGLGDLSPNLVPVCPPHIDPSSPHYKTLQAFTKTQQTLREIAAKFERDECEVAQLFLPYRCQGTLKFVKVADIPSEKIEGNRPTEPPVERKTERRKTTQSQQKIQGIEATLKKLKHDRATGVLQVSHRQESWQFYFSSGQLLCVAGGNDRSRRWYRALRHHCPDFYDVKLPQSLAQEPWEYRLLARGLSEGQIDRTQARKIISFCVWEVLFTIQCCEAVSHQWCDLVPPEAISGLTVDVEKAIAGIQPLRVQKQTLQLPPFCPNLAPILRQPIGGKTNLAMSQFLTGHHSLWDIAAELKRPVTAIARSVLRSVNRGAIELKPVPDLVAPIVPDPIRSKSSPDTSQPAPPLVACIDDSPAICDVMETIVTDAGYQSMGIQDSVQAIPMLLDRKPDLIFLDLVMPIASGYEVCAQIRRISQFKDIPIIIISGKDGVVDRCRARMTGASGFASKPIKRQTVLRMLEKYVPSAVKAQATSRLA